MLKTGMIVAERYEILAKIGTGGMADVYKAKDHKLNRSVAVKVLKPEFREDKTFIRKFKSEAQAAAGLTHPNIVNVYDVGDDEGVYYIVMELIEGITLKDYISKKGKLSIKEATSIAIQVSMGLEAAHSHGIVHRDVKPQNIIISTDGKVKVTDFGIARAASSNTISSNVMGSVHYSSPEQVRGGYSDEKSDIYSLGITIYEMVTGKVPFDGDTTVAIAIKHLQEEMVPPSALTPDLPFSLEQIIYKCTQKSVDRRYQKMEEVIADLKHSLIDPQGDFVKVNQVDNVAKTRVISDKELGEIKQTSKSHREENFDTGVSRMDPEEDYEDEEFEEKTVKKKKKKSEPKAPREKEPKKPKGQNMVLSILILVLGIAILAAAIVFILKATGILDGTFQTPQQNQVTTEAPAQDSAVEVPDLVGKTEAEAKEIANSLQLGIQMMGEEVSTQAKGNISSQSPAAGSKVEANTTLQYYISKGVSDITLAGIVEQNAIEAQASLESQGLTVAVNKEYSELDDNGDALVEPGFVISVSPEEGSAVTPGSTVTLTVSRGKDWGSSASVPNVIGMQTNEALTILGKWLTINVEKQQNAEVPAGQVFAQSLEAESAADPDQPITITVSTGDQTPEAAAAAEEETQAAEETAQTTSSEAVAQATAAGETWLCNQRLNTPDGYQGGAIRLQLIQQTGDSQEVSMIVDGEVVEFPYQLNITGVPGVANGTLYLSELVNGAYQDLGNYSISFEKVE